LTPHSVAESLVSRTRIAVPKGNTAVYLASVDLRARLKNTDKLIAETVLHFACYSPRNYMRVYAAVSKSGLEYSALDWTLVCNHDSAWREDGIRSNCVGIPRKFLDAAAVAYSLERESLVVEVELTRDFMSNSAQFPFVEAPSRQEAFRPTFVF
jgi:hypothetical protein